MALFQRVQYLLKEQGMTVKQLERSCDLANATIRRWETQTPNIESVRRVAEKLNVSIDYLVTGKHPGANSLGTCDGKELVQMEYDLLVMFRLLDNRDKEDVIDIVTMKYEKMRGEKGSIYSTYTSVEGGSNQNDKQLSSENSSGTA